VVGVTAGSSEAPGRKPVTRDNDDDDDNNNNNNINSEKRTHVLNMLHFLVTEI
jgi:hypothetical protein